LQNVPVISSSQISVRAGGDVVEDVDGLDDVPVGCAKAGEVTRSNATINVARFMGFHSSVRVAAKPSLGSGRQARLDRADGAARSMLTQQSHGRYIGTLGRGIES
jgi:hypothetical protein